MRYIIRLLGVFWQNKPKSGSTPGALPPQPKARDFNSNVYFGRTNPTAKGGRVRYFTLAAGPATIERAGEIVRLKVKHIDSAQKIIRIEQMHCATASPPIFSSAAGISG